MPDDTQPPRATRRRRWYQFSLSNLLLATLLACVLLGWQREPIARWVESLWHDPVAVSEDARRPPNFTIQVVVGELAVEGANWPGVELALAAAIAGNSKSQITSPSPVSADGLGFGGLVLPASNEIAVVLVQSLKEGRFAVLSRPQLTTQGNQRAFVEVGQRIQLVQSAADPAMPAPTVPSQPAPAAPGPHVGVILGITPSLADDGRVVMELDVEYSEVGPEAEGIPISVLKTGEVIRSPRINTSTMQTTISALPGQTIVLGGLECPVPGKPDLQKELVIILTPQRVWWDGVESERPTLARELLTRIRQQLPQARLTLYASGNRVIIGGAVRDPSDAAHVVDLAKDYYAQVTSHICVCDPP